MNQESIDKMFVATKAFIEHEGKILVLREGSAYADGSNAGKYDIVGGRVEPGQHFRDSLLREVDEETGLNVSVGAPFFVNEWRPTVRGEKWQIVGIFFRCEATGSQVRIGEDHDHFKWINPSEYEKEGVIENLYPAFEAYLKAK
jgi:8-oxo-dGTP diphosphatase